MRFALQYLASPWIHLEIHTDAYKLQRLLCNLLLHMCPSNSGIQVCTQDFGRLRTNIYLSSDIGRMFTALTQAWNFSPEQRAGNLNLQSSAC